MSGNYGYGERNEREKEGLLQFRLRTLRETPTGNGPPNGMNEISASTLNKCRTGSSHRLVRTRVVVDLKLERINLIRKLTSGIDI